MTVFTDCSQSKTVSIESTKWDKKYQWNKWRSARQDSGRYREIQRVRDWWGFLADRGSMLLPGAPLPCGINGCGGPTGARRGPGESMCVSDCVCERVKENNLIVSPLHCSHQHTTINHCQTQQPVHTNTPNTDTHAHTHTHTLIVIPIGEHLRYMFTCAGQGVAHQRLLDKLSLIESGHTVQVEALQADHMTLGTLKHQHWSPGRHGEAWVTLTVYSYTTPHQIIKVFNVCPHRKQQCCDVIQ